MKASAVASALLLSFVLTGCAQQPKEYVLRVKEKEGNKWEYTYKLYTFADPAKMDKKDPRYKVLNKLTEARVTGHVDMVVKSVKDGNTQFLKTGKTLTSTGTGPWEQQAKDLLTAKPDVALYTWNEQMSNVNIAKEEYYDVLTNSFHGLFPKAAVKVGSEWKYKPYPKAPKEAEAKLVAEEKIEGIDTVKIEILLPASMEGEKNTMTAWIDPTNGRYIRVLTDSVSDDKGLHVENHFEQIIKK